MELYARAGQRAAALHQYQECVRLLQEELGVPPAVETTALAERIRLETTGQHGRLIKNYELQELIGAGGFGEVYHAYQPLVRREVAIKVILPQFANQADFIRRFEAEAQLVAQLEHPHIVPLYDYWREPDGAYLVMRWLRGGSLDATARLWDAQTGDERLVLTGHPSWVTAVAFSPDGSQLAAAGVDQIIIGWDLATGREMWRLAGHTRGIWDIAFNPDGTGLASASDDDTARIWDITPGQEQLILSHTGIANNIASQIAFSPDGTRLATVGEDSPVRLWDAATGQELLTLAGHTDWVYAVAFSPAGDRLATGSGDTSVKLWDAATGQELLTLAGHTSAVSEIAYSPDGLRLATAGYDGSVKLWDAATGQELLTVAKGSSAVQDIAFSPEGTHLGVTSFDGVTRVYVLPIEELVALAQSRLTRALTTEECRQYLHVEACPE